MTLVLQDSLVLSPATAEHLQEEIDTIQAASDVADVVGTYADLEAYDTSSLTDKDVIKVLDDETKDHAQTYWRYSKSGDSFTYIGQIAKPAVDSVNSKTGAVVLDSDDVGAVAKTSTASQVYGTDANGAQTTYNKDDFGQVDDVQVNGVSVVTNKIANVTIPDPLPSQSGNAGKFLKTDGTNASWGDALVNKTNAESAVLIAGNYTAYHGTVIGYNASSSDDGVAGGYGAYATSGAVAIGRNTNSNGTWGVTIGNSSRAAQKGIALGVSSNANGTGSIQLGEGTNNTANTLKVLSYEMMSADGTIPEARLADTTSATAGQVLQLDSNSNAVWADVDSLPDQTSQAGKILGTDGTNAAWETKTTVSFRTWGVNE